MNKTDKITQIGNSSIIQHGKLNDRIYLIKLAEEDIKIIINEISKLATKHNYSKVVAKVAERAAPTFLAEGYTIEGHIPGFYNQKEDAFFVSLFLNKQRTVVPQKQLKVFQQLLLSPTDTKAPLRKTTEAYTIRKLHEKDIPAITSLYSTIFKSYPFPIDDPMYIAQTMSSHVQYFGAFIGNELAGISSAEIDFYAQNAEMTDFATLKEHSGHNLSYQLLETMEYEMKQQKILTLYTIARLNSIPMNKTFNRHKYRYSGTLINNTHITGNIESMNIYYKNLQVIP